VFLKKKLILAHNVTMYYIHIDVDKILKKNTKLFIFVFVFITV
jgi:hypothetical protein